MNKSKTKYVGKNVLRFEDERLLNGNGQYTADINFPGMYHVAFLRSEISHGEIISIATKEFTRMVAVWLKNFSHHKWVYTDGGSMVE